ncbi:N-acetylmuramoyl-L-alanine amidase [Synechococcus sp. CS-1325]|uniref:N-acetylmuramoyl-L-alanine amidase n=1 Tax=Synechococcus sp. CS-1325 TaxID=2847979 RepID=UPI000DB76F2F|nr:N-acetylmuramoyl-L-alanine amidase [Synechococcus sp. CS-1325]MCT0200364.1 N-acetylmuramoyl-L-alanine amidase [Synechococcus sp. CS-1325]PZU99109.1 MAG: N-acetylmuramoyl-L-alanine amidase [Cyanobium sp.]
MPCPPLLGPLRSGLIGGVASLAMLLSALPAQAASALAAWRINRDGVLELRTTPSISLQAFYEAGQGGQGPRIWIDLPGAPQRTRSLRGSGLLREVRIGRPDGATTRLVLEFAPGTQLDPSAMRLVGTARDRWRLEVSGLRSGGIEPTGEGDVDAAAVAWRPRPSPWRAEPSPSAFQGGSGNPLSAGGLPSVPRGRFKVVIDPGHGGPDPGAVGIGGLRETDVVLDVSLQAARLLQDRGVQVLLTRTTEVDVDLPPRVSLANSSGADAFLSIHANALNMSRPDVNGIETFYFQSSLSRALASAVQAEVLAVSPGSPDRGVKPGRFFVIRRTVMPAALVETGFVTGDLDSPRLAAAAHRQQLALAIARGILNYLRGG